MNQNLINNAKEINDEENLIIFLTTRKPQDVTYFYPYFLCGYFAVFNQLNFLNQRIFFWQSTTKCETTTKAIVDVLN